MQQLREYNRCNCKHFTVLRCCCECCAWLGIEYQVTGRLRSSHPCPDFIAGIAGDWSTERQRSPGISTAFKASLDASAGHEGPTM